MDNGLFNENGYKNYIYLGVFIIFLLIVFLFFLFRGGKDSYLIVNESTIIKKEGFKYKQINSLDTKILNGNFNVYSDGEFYKDVVIKNKSNEWYYFDKDYNDLDLNKVSLAYTKTFDGLKEASYDVSFYDENDDEVLSEVLKVDDISAYKNSIIKSSFDIDNDGVVETIYTINNFSLNDSDGNFSFIFLSRNGKLVKIIDKDSNDSFLVQNIVDIDGNGKYELLVSKGTNDVVTYDTCMKIYSINKNKSKCILDCK